LKKRNHRCRQESQETNQVPRQQAIPIQKNSAFKTKQPHYRDDKKGH
jgi:hypothetical protein